MTQKPLLSIVTISYNQAQYIEAAIESVLRGKTDDIEYIVVDPGSTDGSRDIIQSYSSAIDQIVFESDAGPADGLNNGFSRARGRFGYFLNSDDFILPGGLKYLRNLLLENNTVDVFLCSAWQVDEERNPIRELRSTRMSLAGLLSRQTLVQQGMAFSMDKFRQVGGFNPMNQTCWDYELLCAILESGASTIARKDRISAFRMYDNSLSGGVGGEEHLKKYESDKSRISQLYVDEEFPNRSLQTSRFQQLGECLGEVSRKTLRFRELCLPATVKKRWLHDTAE